MSDRDYPDNKRYRLHVQYKNWVGKPDPSGFGDYYVYSDDPSWLHEEAQRLSRKGNRILSTEKNDGGKWVRM